MLNFIISPPEGEPELVPLFAGAEDCKPSHRFGPYVRDCFLIHYCLSGRGRLIDKYGEHKISAGELFIIRPDESTVYEADGKEPWSYIWIGFGGSRAAALSVLPSVMSVSKEPFSKILTYIKAEEKAPDIYISALYEIFYHILSGSKGCDIASSVRRYIAYNYMNGITVGGIASHFGIERSYLYRIFKESFGMGIKEYLTGVRMENAEHFLSMGHTVSECVHMTGYSDASSFFRAYKTHFGISPREKK